jgi:hypothetical protein
MLLKRHTVLCQHCYVRYFANIANLYDVDPALQMGCHLVAGFVAAVEDINDRM